MSSPIIFPLFDKLPEPVRIRIWRFACSLPRIVEIHEVYQTYKDHREGNLQHTKYVTETRSRTRPPAILHVSTEARKVGLKVYTIAYKCLRSKSFGPWYTPVYVNRFTDITYRSRESYPFRIFAPGFIEYFIPLAATNTLAVDVQVLDYDPMRKPPETGSSIFNPREKGRKAIPPSSIAEQIMACKKKGVELIVLVVGNDEKFGEFELNEVDQPSDSAKEVLVRTENLRRAVREVWRRAGSDALMEPPLIKVMEVKRKPIEESFHQFQKLAPELQSMIWDLASKIPRCIFLGGHYIPERSCYHLRIENYRPPPLLSVCRISRSIALKNLSHLDQKHSDNDDSSDNFPNCNSELDVAASGRGYYSKENDIFFLTYSYAMLAIQDISRYKPQRIGFTQITSRHSAVAEKLENVPTAIEITILLGEDISKCEMILETADDGSKESFRLKNTMSGVKDRLEKAGRIVKFAKLVSARRLVSPYSY